MATIYAHHTWHLPNGVLMQGLDKITEQEFSQINYIVIHDWANIGSVVTK